MSFFKTVSAAFVAATIAFGAMASVSTPSFASDQGVEVPPVKTFKKNKTSQKKVSFPKFADLDKKSKKQVKYLALGAAVGAIGYALISSYQNSRD